MSRHRDWDLRCKVYVGNLGNDATKNELETAFNKYGPLRNVWVARSPPGFAFIEYEDPRDAEDAVRHLDGTRICGSRIKVEMSTGRTRNTGGGGGGGGGGGRRGGYGGGGGRDYGGGRGYGGGGDRWGGRRGNSNRSENPIADRFPLKPLNSTGSGSEAPKQVKSTSTQTPLYLLAIGGTFKKRKGQQTPRRRQPANTNKQNET